MFVIYVFLIYVIYVIYVVYVIYVGERGGIGDKKGPRREVSRPRT